MGGGIRVESELGAGANFIVELPLPAAQLPAPAATPSATGVTTAASVLLVEDDALVAEVVAGLLQGSGHRVQPVTQALAALAALATTAFDLVILDLDLPGMDGMELARLLRAQGHSLPLLALTARADSEAEAQAREAGFDGFQRKPVTAAQLQSWIEKLCRAPPLNTPETRSSES